MGDFASSFRQPPPTPPKSNLPTLYYGLVVIATAALLLVLYNLLIVRWCARSHQIQRAPRQRSLLVEISTSQRCENPNRNLLSSFKYKKGVAADEQGVELNNCDCAVCLSAFEEGEEVRKLPRCKHSFHAPCIDMWLYSHSDCPLCRSPVGWRCQRHVVYTQQANSQENVQDSGSSV